MLNRRGAIVVGLVAVVSVAAGWNAGSFKRDLMWRQDWTRLQLAAVGSICKGDRK